MNQTTYYTTMHSPIDELLLVSDGNALIGLSMDPTRHGSTVEAAWKRDPGPFREVVRQLLAYFEGELSSGFALFAAMRFANDYRNPPGCGRRFCASLPGACSRSDVGFRAENRHTVWV
jgi:hypothetical protein